MGWRDDWYPHAVASMIKLRGEGGKDGSSSGARLPLTGALDTLAIIAQFPHPLASAIGGFQADSDTGLLLGPSRFAERCINTRFIKSDGQLRGLDPLEMMRCASDNISILEYLAGYADVLPYHRGPSKSGERYSMWIPESAGAETNIMAQYRHAVGAWQKAVDYSTDMISDYGTDLTAPLSDWRNQGFWKAIRDLCVTMDVIAANPPQSNTTKITEALKVALERSGEVAGRGAAHIAETIGRTAGAAADGFLDTANITAIVVAGLAIYLMVQ